MAIETKLYTPDKQCIDERIRTFKTKVFNTREDAEKEVNRRGGYIYLTYDKQGNLKGYAVPN